MTVRVRATARCRSAGSTAAAAASAASDGGAADLEGRARPPEDLPHQLLLDNSSAWKIGRQTSSCVYGPCLREARMSLALVDRLRHTL